MSKLSKLLEVTKEERQAILKHYNLTEQDMKDYVKRLQEWIAQCEHLPKDKDEKKLEICLINGKMSLEKAKQSIEGYYRVRTLYAAEFFDKLIPNTKTYYAAKKVVKTVVMSKLTPDLCRVTIFKLCDPNGEADDAYLYTLIFFMMTELRLSNDFYLSNATVIDYGCYSWKNLVKFTPSINQKLVDMLVSVHLRIHSVHFINVPSFLDQVMWILKNLLPAKIMQKINTHKSLESLHECIPPECLPSNYGGTQKSFEELYEDWCGQLENSEEVFKNLLNAKSTKKFEVDTSIDNSLGIGMEGSFKKLAID